MCHNCPAWAKCFLYAIKTLDHESMWMFDPPHLPFLNDVMHGQLDEVLMVHISATFVYLMDSTSYKNLEPFSVILSIS